MVDPNIARDLGHGRFNKLLAAQLAAELEGYYIIGCWFHWRYIYLHCRVSGIDICSFSVLTLLFRVSEKTATPTSQ